MKKLWLVLSLIMTTHYSFAAAEKKVATAKPIEGKPAVVLQVFDLNGKVARPIKGNILNISKKQSRLCWYSVNIPTQGKVMIAEAFYAPSRTKFISEGSRYNPSPDGTSNTIVTNLTNATPSNIQRCWDFNNSDPAGIYRIDIQINDYVFTDLTFEVKK